MPEVFTTLVQEYGYPIFFLILLSGLIGLPVPDEGVLIFAGILVAKGKMFFLPALVVGILAFGAGALFNYWVAFHFGRWKLPGWGKRADLPARQRERAVRLIYSFGLWAIPLCCFIPGIRISASYGAGIMRMAFPGYIAASFCGGLGWVGFYLWLGTRIAQ